MPASFPGSFQAKSAASRSSATPRLPRLKTSSKKRRTRALFSSSSDTRASSCSLPTCVCPMGRHHKHDATWRPPAHWLEAYSPKCLEWSVLRSWASGCPVTRCNIQITKKPELKFRDVLTEDGAERLELA